MNLDRTGTIGASDTRYVMMNWETKTFRDWFAKKLGIIPYSEYQNIYMQTGTMLEEHIINTLNKREGLEIYKPEPIIKGRLVVNLDGMYKDVIYEIKTMKWDHWMFRDIDKSYWKQVQVQMFAAEKEKAFIVAYGVCDHEYDFEYCLNPEIDYSRIMKIPVEYSEPFIEKYKRRFDVLIDCLDKGTFPEEQWIK